jgi:hypothetical protein
MEGSDCSLIKGTTTEFCQERLRKTVKTSVRVADYHTEMNPGFSEHEAGVLTCQLCLIIVTSSSEYVYL